MVCWFEKKQEKSKNMEENWGKLESGALFELKQVYAGKLQ